MKPASNLHQAITNRTPWGGVILPHPQENKRLDDLTVTLGRQTVRELSAMGLSVMIKAGRAVLYPRDQITPEAEAKLQRYQGAILEYLRSVP